jgi:hypothetical protein
MIQKQWLVINRDNGSIDENNIINIDETTFDHPPTQNEQVHFVLDHMVEGDEDHNDIVEDMMSRKRNTTSGCKVVDEDIIYYVLDVSSTQ